MAADADATNVSWLAKAVSDSCVESSQEWSTILAMISTNGDRKLKEKYGTSKRFAGLSEAEQANIVENEFFQVFQLACLLFTCLCGSLELWL